MRSRFHGLKQPRIRQTWNKHNLYNLSRYKPPSLTALTFYQQKWKAKSSSRAYHGEQIREKQWQRMFRPRAAAVIPMDYRYLAEHDGSELAAGRGSGREQPFDPGRRTRARRQIPYMSMVYAPIERRLDTAVFRALFASSARQARQFVVHGKVKVNGKKMPYPGYLLNPGDMFQVDPERVLFATGAQKSKSQIVQGRGIRRAIRARNINMAKRREAAKEAENKEEAAASSSTPSSSSEDPKKAELERRRTKLHDLRAQAKALLADGKNPPSGRRKQELRTITRSIRNTFSQVAKMPLSEIDSLIAGFSKRLVLNPTEESDKAAADREITEVDEAAFKEAVRRARENPIDDSKPYATPWRPRPYMSAFAFIPRYLEVNQNICAAVYLRHPVARPGHAEVPSPFPQEIMQLAHNWYLRRR
ncbi:hypothetical protein ACMFMG_003306 [Clarireedia jacksonii]